MSPSNNRKLLDLFVLIQHQEAVIVNGLVKTVANNSSSFYFCFTCKLVVSFSVLMYIYTFDIQQW